MCGPTLTALLDLYSCSETIQNRCQKFFSSGALRLCRQACCLLKFDQTPLIYSVSYYNLRGLGALFVGAKPTKTPVATGLKRFAKERLTKHFIAFARIFHFLPYKFHTNTRCHFIVRYQNETLPSQYCQTIPGDQLMINIFIPTKLKNLSFGLLDTCSMKYKTEFTRPKQRTTCQR